MKRLTMSGVITNIKTGTTQNGEPWANLSITDTFIKKDGTQQVITEGVGVFNAYLINQINAGLIGLNMPVVIEADVRAEAYAKQDGTPAAKLSYVANMIWTILVPQAQPQQAPAAQAQAFAPNQNAFAAANQPLNQQQAGYPNGFAPAGPTTTTNNGMFSTTPIQQTNTQPNQQQTVVNPTNQIKF